MSAPLPVSLHGALLRLSPHVKRGGNSYLRCRIMITSNVRKSVESAAVVLRGIFNGQLTAPTLIYSKTVRCTRTQHSDGTAYGFTHLPRSAIARGLTTIGPSNWFGPSTSSIRRAGTKRIPPPERDSPASFDEAGADVSSPQSQGASSAVIPNIPSFIRGRNFGTRCGQGSCLSSIPYRSQYPTLHFHR